MSAERVLGSELSGPLRTFFDFWNSLPKKDLLPQLSDLQGRMPPDVAPYVAIVDVRGPEDAPIRFFGTQLAERAAFDPTGKMVADLYAPELRPAVHRLLWEAVRRPVGYLSHRRLVGREGFANVHPSVGLPIEIEAPTLRGIVNFTRSLAPMEHLTLDRAHLVQQMTLAGWVDIGAGIPE
jgi:hypothetical protein